MGLTVGTLPSSGTTRGPLHSRRSTLVTKIALISPHDVLSLALFARPLKNCVRVYFHRDSYLHFSRLIPCNKTLFLFIGTLWFLTNLTLQSPRMVDEGTGITLPLAGEELFLGGYPGSAVLIRLSGYFFGHESTTLIASCVRSVIGKVTSRTIWEGASPVSRGEGALCCSLHFPGEINFTGGLKARDHGSRCQCCLL